MRNAFIHCVTHPKISVQTTGKFDRLFLKYTCGTYGLSTHLRHISSMEEIISYGIVCIRQC